MKIAHATTHDSQIICTRPCGAFGVAHAHLLDARDEAVLMSRMSTQESRALSNKESLEEGRSVFDLSESGRPGASKAGSRERKQKTKNRGGPGGPALRIRPRRRKNPEC